MIYGVCLFIITILKYNGYTPHPSLGHMHIIITLWVRGHATIIMREGGRAWERGYDTREERNVPAALSVVFSVPSKADVYQHCTALFGLSESKLLTSFIAKNSKSTRKKFPSLSFLFPTFVCVCLPLFHLLLFLQVLPFFSPTLSLSLSLSLSSIQVNVAPNTVMASRLKRAQVRQTKQSKPIYTHSQD